MEKKKLLKTIVFLMFGIFIADHFADKFYLYDTTVWVSMIMHFLGGFWVSLFFLYVSFDKLPLKRRFYFVIFSTIAIGVGWEIFEMTLDMIAKAPHKYSGTTLDTVADLVFDILGAVAAIYYNKVNGKRS